MIVALGMVLASCNGSESNNTTGFTPPACGDAEDNDEDGMIDFPDDLGCTSENDESEDSSISAKCQDGRDNDSDGKTDYPSDPGCFAPQADDEADDCPDGPMCSQCADGEDNDGNGQTDYPADPGCTAAADDSEYLSNPVACGASLMVLQIPPTGLVMGELGAGSTSMITSPCGGGGGAAAHAYELHLNTNRVVEVTTDDGLTTLDTVIDIRSQDCMAADAEVACNDDISPTNERSRLIVSLEAGTYYIIVGGRDTAATGAYAMQLKTFAGEGTGCVTEMDCGPGLVCRNTLGATATTCEKPQCADMIDDDQDGDGGGYPSDPGCANLEDNDEADTCPGVGPGCPECADGADNDADGNSDYPADTTCRAASDASESCISTDGVALITTAQTMGTTVGANHDVTPTTGCGSTTGTAPDKTYRIDLPAMSSLTISNTNTFDAAVSLLGSSCSGAPLACSDEPETLTVSGLAAGAYYYIIDGYSIGTGAFTIGVSGKIAANGRCDGTLATDGALVCDVGFSCEGPVGNRRCTPKACGDGSDNDGDGRADYPLDPGCETWADDNEADPAAPPVCANGINEDMDATTDFPADYGCTAASGTSEAFCTGETDPPTVIATNPITRTTTGLTNNFASQLPCQGSASGPDVAYSLQIPVHLQSLVIDTSDVGTTLTTFDTILSLRDANCGVQLSCDDDSGTPGTESKLTATNVSPGNYALVVDGYNGQAGTFNMTVKGVASPGQACTSPLFSGGANAVLSCPTACTAGVCQ